MDKPWKAFERESATLLGGKRAWANSGEQIDVTSDRFVAQCKLVQRMSLAELHDLADAIAHDPRLDGVRQGRLGLVCVKLRRGKGNPSRSLVVMTSETFTQLIGYTRDQP
jgi:hypothetical protein